MGAWGNNSWECDDVQDELDQHWNMKAPGPHRQAAGVHTIVSNMKVDKSYNPTLRVGVVLGLLDTTDLSVGKKTIQLAIDDLKVAMADEDYIKTWVNPAERIKAMKSELASLNKALKK